MGGSPARFTPSAKPRDAKRTMLRIGAMYMRYGKSIFFASALTAISAGIAVAVPYFIGKTFDAFDVSAVRVDFTALYWLLALLVALYAANWAVTTAGSVLMLKVSQRIVLGLRSAFFEKLQRLPLKFFDTRPHGDTMSRLTNDVDNISVTIAQTTTQLVSSALTLGGSLIVMLRLSPLLTLAVLASVPLFTLLTRTIASRSRRFFIAQQKSLGTLSGIVEENITGLKMVKAFGRQGEVMERFQQVNEALADNSTKAQVWSGFLMPLMNVINNLVFALVAVVGGVLSVRQGLAVGVVVSFLSYSKQFGMPLNAVAGMFSTIQAALAGAERVLEVLDEAEEAPDAENAVAIDVPEGRVTFEHVSFSYDKKKPVLTDICFDVRPGETIALVGETGAGKTTVVALLTRAYDADAGRILIDGIPVTDIRRASLRDCFSVVLQDTCLFTGTILDNIRYSKPDATDAQVIAAAKLARAHGFIEKLPDGYRTMVSGTTDNLSEGQRQLLAIARAVLCDAPILILDEATSSVDTKTEKDIQRAMLELMQNRTSFLIAHRLSTIRDADRILVISDGRLLECGNHEELLRQRGLYYRMVESQLGLSG